MIKIHIIHETKVSDRKLVEVGNMVRIEDIPAETRWEIAAKSASALPLFYEKYFRKVLGDRYDDIERSLWP